MGHSKVVTRRLVHSALDGDALAEIEGRCEVVEGYGALRPLDAGRECEPDSGDDAIRAPGVQDVMHGCAFVQMHLRLALPW